MPSRAVGKSKADIKNKKEDKATSRPSKIDIRYQNKYIYVYKSGEMGDDEAEN